MSIWKVRNILVKIPKIYFSDKLSCNSILRSSCIPNMFMSMDSCQTPTYIFIDFLLINDNSNEALEILSNFHISLVGFLSYLEMRIYRMSSALTRSDRFFIDLFTTFRHNPSYPEHPVHDLVMIEYELKYGFMCTRFYGDLRSKGHLHNFHLENYLLICK